MTKNHNIIKRIIFLCLIVFFLNFFLTGKSYAASPQVWVEDGMTRVFKNDPAKTASTISLFSAKNEYEPFQIVVKAPAANNLTGVNVTVSNLTGANGVISASNITLYREHYLYVTQGSKHQTSETNRPLGPGWYPDGLIPFKDPSTNQDLSGQLDAVPFNLSAGENQPIWADIYTPANTPAGTYQGTATISSAQGNATVNFTLNVWNFSLPKIASLKGSFHTWVYYNRSTVIEILKHRAKPKHVPITDERFLMDNYGLDMRAAFRESGANRFTCNTTSAVPSVSEVQAEVAKHEPGLFLYDSYANEVWACASQAQVFLDWAKNLRLGGIHPAIVTHPLDAFMGSDLNNTVADNWSILPKYYDQSKANIDKLVNHPTTSVWSYNPLVQDGYSPKFTIDFLPVNFRIMQGFINQSLGMTGTKFWRIDNWTADPWNNAEVTRADAPGEGHLVNRGDDVGLPGQIVPGVRMKLFREGSEDFEYVQILKNLGQSQFALQTVRSVAVDFHTWSQDKNILLSARKILGDKIDSLSGNPLPSPTRTPVPSPTPFRSPTPTPIQATNPVLATRTPTPTGTLLPPRVRIVAPSQNQTLEGSQVSVVYQEDGDLSQVDHVHLQLDSQPEVRDLDNDGNYLFNNLFQGTHTLLVYLARADHTRFPNPEAQATVSFYVYPGTSPTGTVSCVLKSKGDANCDGLLDLIDFEYWRREFTTTVTTKNADYNSDGQVDLVDFEIWRRSFTSVATSPTLTSTPTKTPTTSPHYSPTPSATLGPSPTPTPTYSLQAKPNIIFILTDDQTLESLSAMPYLSSRTDWFYFNQATVNVAYCCPSRATILTGKYAHHTGVIDNGSGAQMNENDTIALALQKAGYRTGLIGKYLNGFPFGRPYYIPAGWNHWEAYAPVNPPGQYNYGMYENGNLVNYGSAPADYSTDVIARKAIKFLETVQQPFFLYVAPYTPHGPMIPAPRHIGAYANRTMPRFPNFNEADVSDKPAWVRSLSLTDPAGNDGRRRSQYEMLLSVDEMIEKIVATVGVRGFLDNSVIIFMTDNGYSHGEHRYRQKLCEYEECIRSPLKIRYPYSSPRTIDALVQNIDIAPTLADLAGISFTTTDGLSLLPLLKNQSIAWRTGTLHYWKGDSAVTGFWAVRRKDWKYVELVTGERELYNLISDPYELENLAGLSSTSTIQAQLAAELLQLKQ